MEQLEIAIIGAGISGLMAATHFAENGRSSVLFDKGRGPGGRMSSRNTSKDGKKLEWRKSGAKDFH